jgi:hypothetical protein
LSLIALSFWKAAILGYITTSLTLGAAITLVVLLDKESKLEKESDSLP